MRFPILKVAMFLLVLGLLALPSESPAAGMGGPGWGNSYGQQMTPEQLETAREIIGSNFANMDSTRQALAAKRNELDALLDSPNPDGARIESLSREIGELRGKMLSARAQIRSQLAQKGLSPDFLGPDLPPDQDNYAGPRPYHHNRHHRGWGNGRGGWGCGGCWW